ncbi:MAG: hypothetical protein EHM56_02385, partial [Chloroflexi bacterium]
MSHLTAWVDLTTGEHRREPTGPALVQQYLGGRGLGVALLTRHQAGDGRTRGSDPFSP